MGRKKYGFATRYQSKILPIHRNYNNYLAYVYLILAEELITGKNIPFRLKFRKYPGIFIPL